MNCAVVGRLQSLPSCFHGIAHVRKHRRDCSPANGLQVDLRFTGDEVSLIRILAVTDFLGEVIDDKAATAASKEAHRVLADTTN